MLCSEPAPATLTGPPDTLATAFQANGTQARGCWRAEGPHWRQEAEGGRGCCSSAGGGRAHALLLPPASPASRTTPAWMAGERRLWCRRGVELAGAACMPACSLHLAHRIPRCLALGSCRYALQGVRADLYSHFRGSLVYAGGLCSTRLFCSGWVCGCVGSPALDPHMAPARTCRSPRPGCGGRPPPACRRRLPQATCTVCRRGAPPPTRLCSQTPQTRRVGARPLLRAWGRCWLGAWEGSFLLPLPRQPVRAQLRSAPLGHPPPSSAAPGSGGRGHQRPRAGPLRAAHHLRGRRPLVSPWLPALRCDGCEGRRQAGTSVRAGPGVQDRHAPGLPPPILD